MFPFSSILIVSRFVARKGEKEEKGKIVAEGWRDLGGRVVRVVTVARHIPRISLR